MISPTLDGARIRLRLPTQEDIAFSLRFANDEDLRGWLRFWRPTSEVEERTWIDALPDGADLVWLMERRSDGAPLGFISLTQLDVVSAHAELGLGILRAEDRGAGVGREAIALVLAHAFDVLRLQRVHLHVYTDNPAVRLYERVGFRVEGTARRHAFKRGAWRDQHMMGLLREEWRR